jgi:drug/metabolite transporter (DMT)-like permease
MVGATALFICMNVAVKVLSAGLPTLELVWSRNLGHSLFILAIFGPGHGGWRLFVTRKPAVQISRSLLLLASTSFFFMAIGHVPLADATTVSFTAPLMVAVLAGPALGERVTAGHWTAIVTGFAGALLVIRPTGEGTDPRILLVFGSAVCYAIYQLLTRHLAGIDPPETSVTYSALVGTLVLSALIPFYWKTPDRAWQAGLLAVLGLLGGLGHYFVARAFTYGPASLISPFHYAQLLWAAVLGYLVFGDVPGAWTWIGATLIIGSGLSIAIHEARRR